MARINSKKKGNRVELELTKLLSEKFNDVFKRVPMSGAWGTNNRNSGVKQEALDTLSGDIMCPDKFKYSVEVKGRSHFNFFDFFNEKSELKSWIEQCEGDADRTNKLPMIVVKINHQQPFFMIKGIEGDFKYKDWYIFSKENFMSLENHLFFT